MRKQSGSWAILTCTPKNEEKLVELLDKHYLFFRNGYDSSKPVSQNIMESLGYNLEYSMSGARNSLRHVYVWKPDLFSYQIKEAYMMIGTLTKAGCKLVGVLEEKGIDSLYWVDTTSGKIVLKTVYFSNIDNGFSKKEDLEGLQEVLDYLNPKEKVMLALGTPFFAGWFEKMRNLLSSFDNRY